MHAKSTYRNDCDHGHVRTEAQREHAVLVIDAAIAVACVESVVRIDAASSAHAARLLQQQLAVRVLQLHVHLLLFGLKNSSVEKEKR